ncbi:MAG: tetratricopeptide repeat protein [Phycisphaerae bacterium]
MRTPAHRMGKFHAIRRVIAAILVTGMAALGAAQPTPLPQDGRLFDANPQLGGTRSNGQRPVSALTPGNALATGNLRGGFSLRSFSPISDPTAFRGPLGSDLLSNFRRDAFSVSDVPRTQQPWLAQGYYDPARTVATPGFLSGQSSLAPGPTNPRTVASEVGVLGGPGVSAYRNPMDLRLDLRVSLDARSQFVSPVSRRALLDDSATKLTGPQSLAGLRAPALDEQERIARSVSNPLVITPNDPLRPALNDVAGDAPLGGSPAYGTPMDLILRGDARQMLATTPTTATLARPGILPDADQATTATERAELRRREVAAAERVPPKLTDFSVLPGHDVFTDMQLALSLARDPRAEWFLLMREAVRGDPNVDPQLRQAVEVKSEEFVERMMATPLKSFVGRGKTEINDTMLKAESLMDVGQYHEAAARFEQARALDPANPLPYIGKGHALLAAGDYLTAANLIARGLERFPELARFRVDLQMLLGGAEIVDIRRADLMNQLRNAENPSLRFLLGYIEYHAGDRESGLRNLDRAAEAAPQDSFIRRYAPALRGDGMLPPPRIPGPDSPTPTEPR